MLTLNNSQEERLALLAREIALEVRDSEWIADQAEYAPPIFSPLVTERKQDQTIKALNERLWIYGLAMEKVGHRFMVKQIHPVPERKRIFTWRYFAAFSVILLVYLVALALILR